MMEGEERLRELAVPGMSLVNTSDKCLKGVVTRTELVRLRKQLPSSRPIGFRPTLKAGTEVVEEWDSLSDDLEAPNPALFLDTASVKRWFTLRGWNLSWPDGSIGCYRKT